VQSCANRFVICYDHPATLMTTGRPGRAAFRPTPLASSHPALQEEGRMTAPVIAVMDNDPSFLSLMHDLLTEEGYAPLLWHAPALPDPHALLRRIQPALVILDLWIERRDDGWEVLERLWADAETAHIPAVIVTGEPDVPPVRADRLRAMRCAVVRRPFDLQELLDAIAAALGGSRAHGERTPVRAAIPSAAERAADLTDNPLATVAGAAVTTIPPIPPPGGDDRGGRACTPECLHHRRRAALPRALQPEPLRAALVHPLVRDRRRRRAGEIREYPGRFADEGAAWEGARRAADASR
jgi:CheY-like chemotaxis protein